MFEIWSSQDTCSSVIGIRLTPRKATEATKKWRSIRPWSFPLSIHQVLLWMVQKSGQPVDILKYWLFWGSVYIESKSGNKKHQKPRVNSWGDCCLKTCSLNSILNWLPQKHYPLWGVLVGVVSGTFVLRGGICFLGHLLTNYCSFKLPFDVWKKTTKNESPISSTTHALW